MRKESVNGIAFKSSNYYYFLYRYKKSYRLPVRVYACQDFVKTHIIAVDAVFYFVKMGCLPVLDLDRLQASVI